MLPHASLKRTGVKFNFIVGIVLSGIDLRRAIVEKFTPLQVRDYSEVCLVSPFNVVVQLSSQGARNWGTGDQARVCAYRPLPNLSIVRGLNGRVGLLALLMKSRLQCQVCPLRNRSASCGSHSLSGTDLVS